MKIYSIYLPPGVPDSDIHPETRFLTNGKSWPAFLSPIWLLWKGLWQEFFIYMALQIILFLLDLSGLRVEMIILSIILQIYLLLEGNELVRLQHERKGWSHIGMVYGNNMEEVEIRYFKSLPADREPDVPTTINNTMPDNAPHRQSQQQSIGLFPLEDMALNRKGTV